MKKWLCYWELHVADKTFCVHVIVEAADMDAALEKLQSDHGSGYHLQAKGCLGEATMETLETYLGVSEMKDYIR